MRKLSIKNLSIMLLGIVFVVSIVLGFSVNEVFIWIGIACYALFMDLASHAFRDAPKVIYDLLFPKVDNKEDK